MREKEKRKRKEGERERERERESREGKRKIGKESLEQRFKEILVFQDYYQCALQSIR